MRWPMQGKGLTVETSRDSILAGMDATQSYVAQVDRILAAAVSLFPAEAHGAELQRDPAPAGGDLPDGDSGLAAATGAASDRYRRDDARAVALSDALYSSVTEAFTHARQARESARAIAQTAATGARAVLAEGLTHTTLCCWCRRWTSVLRRCRTTSSRLVIVARVRPEDRGASGGDRPARVNPSRLRFVGAVLLGWWWFS